MTPGFSKVLRDSDARETVIKGELSRLSVDIESAGNAASQCMHTEGEGLHVLLARETL